MWYTLHSTHSEVRVGNGNNQYKQGRPKKSDLAGGIGVNPGNGAPNSPASEPTLKLATTQSVKKELTAAGVKMSEPYQRQVFSGSSTVAIGTQKADGTGVLAKKQNDGTIAVRYNFATAGSVPRGRTDSAYTEAAAQVSRARAHLEAKGFKTRGHMMGQWPNQFEDPLKFYVIGRTV